MAPGECADAVRMSLRALCERLREKRNADNITGSADVFNEDLFKKLQDITFAGASDGASDGAEELRCASKLLGLISGPYGFNRSVKFAVECDFVVACSRMIRMQGKPCADIALSGTCMRLA